MLGLDDLLTRQVARFHSQASRYLSVFLLYKILISGVSYGILVFFVSRIAGYSITTARPIILLGLSLIPESLGSTGQAHLIAHERFGVSLLAGILSSLIKIVGGTLALLNGAGLDGVAWVWIGGSSIGAIVNLLWAIQISKPLNLNTVFIKSFWIENLKLAVPFISIGLLLALEYQLDVIILSLVRNEAEVSWYTAATTIYFSLALLVQSFRNAIYPVMILYQNTSPDKLARVYDLALSFLSILALPMAAGLILLSPSIVTLIYKKEFLGAVVPLQIISCSLVFYYLNVPNIRLMLVHEKQNWITAFQVCSLAVNVVLNLLLDPRLGATGASIARLAAILTFFIPNYLYVTRKFHKHNLLHSLAKPALATIVMALGLWFIRDWNIWLAILIGFSIYWITLLIIRGLTQEERTWLRQLILEQK